MKAFCCFLVLVPLWCAISLPTLSAAEFKAGAASVDVTPQKLPVIQNGGFLERKVRLVVDPLAARVLVMQSGDETVALVVVDSCMMHREFCDVVKTLAAEKTGIAKRKILLSATHTHSAPSVMDYCLGTRADAEYAKFLPGKIVEAIVEAQKSLRPAEAAWTRFDAGDLCKNRRWIFRSGLEQADPFGEKTVRANMHPGHQNPNAIGESGPTDPWFTLLSIRDHSGRPLALWGNFSMHYFSGHSGISADYFGHYVRAMESKLAGGDDGKFVAMLSQGTSGDLWRADYSKPRPKKGWAIEAYAGELAERSVKALEGLKYLRDFPLAMAEERVEIGRRTPDEKRLAWAREVVAEMGERRPKDKREVYAEQAIFLHENPKAEVVLQALRVGGLAITAMPNEVYAITGLKLKHRSPMGLTMNIELANGASGYIPPPEQLELGGYNTWPARTAGLVVESEPRIVETNLRLLEKVSGKSRKNYREPSTPYALEVLRAKPRAYWRLGDLDRSKPEDVAPGQLPAHFEKGVVFHLPGAVGKDGRCAHFWNGRLAAKCKDQQADYSVSFWFWNGMQHKVRPVTGYLFSRGADGDEAAPGDHLGVGGTHSDTGRLIVFNGNRAEGLLAGKTELGIKKWHHVTLVRRGGEVVVHLDGREEIRGKLEITHGGSRDLFFGGRSDGFAKLEGRLDELAFFDRALTGKEARGIYAASAPLEAPPLSPQESLEQTQVKDGFVLELVAAEPLVRDPVAVDWGEDGSVWVAEMADYPYGVEGGGRVARLVDSNQDGALDRREDFLSGLSFPAGVMAWGKGVIITAAPDIIYAEDRNGDGHAEHVEKWFSGFIEGNQQLRVNGLRMGLDGWIYCASGGHHAGFGTKTVVVSHKTGAKIEIGSRDFRFKPDGSLEAESGPSQFGRVRDDTGNWFGVQNALPLWHYVLPDRYLRRNPDAPAPDPRRQLRDRQPRLFSAKASQKRFHGFDHVGRYTSACGISIYRDELLFPRLSGRTIAFTCAPFHNLVQRHVLQPDGVSFSARRGDDGEVDFFASRDRWCRPVMSRTAPDGSLWVVDMYRYMIEHPDWLPQQGKDELRPHYRAGEDRGRIYRIYPEGRKPPQFGGLREGMEIGRNGIVNDLVLRTQQQKVRSRLEVSHESAAGRALALALGAPAKEFLGDPEAAIRALAVRKLETQEDPPSEVFGLLDDPSEQVRLQLAFSLGEWKSEAAAKCLTEIALQSMTADHRDPHLRAAILSSAVPHFESLFKAVLAADSGDETLMLALLDMARDEVALPVLTEPKNPTATRLFSAAEWIKRRGGAEEFNALAEVAGELLRDEEAEVGLRRAAAAMVVARERKFPRECLSDPVMQRAAIQWSCRFGIGAQVIDHWASFSPSTRSTAIDAMLLSKKNVAALLDGIEAGAISPKELAAAQRQRVLETKDKALKARAIKSLGAAIGKGSEVRGKIVARYTEEMAKLQGDKIRGKAHFATACALCHQLDGVGKAVGPDLMAITSRTRPALLSAIIDPNRNVEPRYLAYSARSKDSVLAYGMVAAETATSVIFKLLDGSQQAVSRKEMVRLENEGRSLMPEGLEAALDPQAMADLLAYLEAALVKR